MMRRGDFSPRRTAVVTLGLLAFSTVAPIPAAACSLAADAGPTAGYVGRTADSMILGRITDLTRVVAAPDPVDIAVIRSLRGDVPSPVHLQAPIVAGCGVDLSSLRARTGSRLVVALGIGPRYGTGVTTAAWVEQDNGRWLGVAGSYPDLSSLLIDLDPLPETASNGPRRPPDGPLAPLAILAFVAALLLVWRRQLLALDHGRHISRQRDGPRR